MEINYEYRNKTILTISDQHMPYHHRDMFRFLNALKKKYKPDLVINMGDALDFHSISFHQSDPNLSSASGELESGRDAVAEMEELFPNMAIISSNHGDLPLRKFVANGLPRQMLRPYNDIYGVSETWRFVDDLMLIPKDGPPLYFCHGISKNGIKLATQRGVCVTQGHHHTEFRIDYVSNPKDLIWSLQVGCLIDPKSLAFAYDKLNLTRPIIGTGLIVNGQPKLEPMTLDRSGRWVGQLS